MSTDIRPDEPSDGVNPYAPPLVEAGAELIEPAPVGDRTTVEVIRRAHIGYESSVRSIGWLYFLTAGFLLFFVALVPLWVVLSLLGSGGSLPVFDANLVAGLVGCLVLGGLFVGLGLGMTGLKPWARWLHIIVSLWMLVFYSLSLLYDVQLKSPFLSICIQMLVFGYVALLLLRSPATKLFSSEYKTIVAQTPQVSYWRSLVLKVFVALVLVSIIVTSEVRWRR